jgi:hypothetical protein
MKLPKWWPWMRKPRNCQYLVIEDDGDGVSVRVRVNQIDEDARLDFLGISMRAIAKTASPTRDHDDGIARLIARSRVAHEKPE